MAEVEKEDLSGHPGSTGEPLQGLEIDDCVLWEGTPNSNGYGPHKERWEAANGPVPPGHELHHRCLQRLCLNGEHLVLLTRAAHRRVHATLRDGPPEHGTRRMYDRRCRCPRCQAWNAARKAKWLKRRR